jgi:hydroxyethylthiazole kinase-like sugar kinase family protein
MSSSPIPITESATPFVPTTTPAIERANRLISLRTHPGFLDILRLSQELVDSATAILVNYGGWDKDQITVLKVRAQAAKEHHELLIAKINDAIQDGIAEGRAQAETLPTKTAEESVDQGDYVRQKMMQKFEELDTRPSGSY